MKKRFWTSGEDALLRKLYPHKPTKDLAAFFNRPISQVYQHAYCLGLTKTAAYLASPGACRLRHGDNVGWAYRFPKGHVPFNKGSRRPGYAPGRMAETQFKKGAHPHTWRPLGSFRFSKEGYLQRKVRDTGYPPRDWIGVHILKWLKNHHRRRLPKGHCLRFRDGDKTNVRLRNLELITRSENMRRNSIHNTLPPALKQCIQLTGALKRRIRNREGKLHAEKSDVGSTRPPFRNSGIAEGPGQAA